MCSDEYDTIRKYTVMSMILYVSIQWWVWYYT